MSIHMSSVVKHVSLLTDTAIPAPLHYTLSVSTYSPYFFNYCYFLKNTTYLCISGAFVVVVVVVVVA